MSATEKMYMNTATGSVDTRDGWDYENEAGETVNAVDMNEVVEVVTLDGITYNQIDVYASLMSDELREELHSELAPCGDQEFLDAYAEAHQKKYGEKFAF